MANILMVGGAGLVGCHLTLHLHAQGHRIWIIDNLHAAQSVTGRRAQINQLLLKQVQDISTFCEGTVCDEELVERVIGQAQPQIVYYLAALLASESAAFPMQALASQVDGLRTTLDSLTRYGHTERLVLASSSYVYGDFDSPLIDEHHPRRPLDVYGRTKLMAEELIHIYHHFTGLEYCIVRPAAIYGVGDARPRFASQAIDLAIEHQDVSIYDPDFISDFTYIEDAVQGFELAAFVPSAANQVFNITYGQAATNAEFKALLASIFTQEKILLQNTAEEEGLILPKRGALDVSKAKRILGYAPRFEVRAGILRYIESYKNIQATA